MAIGDFYQLTAHYSSLAGPVSFGQAYEQISGTNDGTTADNALAYWRFLLEDDLQALLSIEMTVNEYTWEPASGVNEIPGFMQPDSVSGLDTGSALPNNVACVISQLTDAPKAKCNGRIFVAGLSEDQMQDGLFNPAGVALVQTFADGLEDNLVVTGPPASEFKPVVISRFLDGSPRVPPVAYDVVSNTAKSEPRQQRRRTTKRHGIF